jgi:hypothetical protein
MSTTNTKASWQEVIDAYHALPEEERTTLNVAAKLNKNGWRIRPDTVATVLKATVLQDLITEDEVRATAKVLNYLVDLTLTEEHGGNFRETASWAAEDFTSGLDVIDAPKAYSLRVALSYLLDLLLRHLEQSRDIGRYAPPPRYVVQSKYHPNDLTF